MSGFNKNWHAFVQVTLGVARTAHHFTLETNESNMTLATGNVEAAVRRFKGLGATCEVMGMARGDQCGDGSDKAEQQRQASLIALARCVLDNIAKSSDDE